MALLSLNDIAGLAFTDGKHPPYAVAALGAALGLISLVLVVLAWRGGPGIKALLVVRVVSALTALPAFFISDVPVAAVIDASAIVGLTALATLLLARSSTVARTGSTSKAAPAVTR
jgi:hypothetical protein